jgi:DNA-binding NarL/FixJ family response regulator
MTVPTAQRPIRVLIVDDSPLIRVGLKAVLEDRREIVIAGEAATAAEGLAGAEQLRPDVVLLDLRLPDASGLSVCRELLKRQPGALVLILTSATDERNVQDAVSAGAKGYLLKDSDGTSLANAIVRVAAGHSVIDPALSDHVLNLMRRPSGASPEERLASLSLQERRVIALLTEGLTNKEIGDRLNLTEKTVKNYLSTIFDKLGITRRAQAAAIYAQSSLSKPS